MMDPQVLLSIGRTPLSADAPTGINVRYEPEFERLEAQIRRLDSLAGEQPDWATVVTLGRGILETKSKDLLVACYLALGLFHADGYRGLAAALGCIEGLIDGFWPLLYPEMKRLRARFSALAWLSERAGTEVGRRAPGAGEAESVNACDEALARIDSALGRAAGSEAVGLVELRRALKERVGQAATAPPPAAAPATSEPRAPEPRSSPATRAAIAREEDRPAAPASASTAAPGSIETREDCQRVVREARTALKRAVTFLRRQAPSEPAPYRLVRALTWFDVEALPPNESGRTRIPSPPSHVRDRCQALRIQAAWLELLNEAETRFPEYPFWLDLQRFSVEALAGLGAPWARALDAVEAEVATLLARLPELSDLRFADDVPFADEATRSAFASRTAIVAEPALPLSIPATAGADLLDELRAESRRLLADHQADAALAMLQDAGRRAPDERTRFLIDFELARACVELGQARAALACFDVLDERMTRFSLDAWDPSLAATVLQAHWKALNDARGSRDADLDKRSDVVFARLCALDMVAGMRAGQCRDARAPGASRKSG